MKFLRTHFFGKCTAIWMGIVLLNMSLFLAEAEALQLLRDKKMKLNISKLVTNASNEEEKCLGGNGEEETSPSNEIEYLLGQSLQANDLFLLDQQHDFVHVPDKVKGPLRETVIPPPKV